MITESRGVKGFLVLNMIFWSNVPAQHLILPLHIVGLGLQLKPGVNCIWFRGAKRGFGGLRRIVVGAGGLV